MSNGSSRRAALPVLAFLVAALGLGAFLWFDAAGAATRVDTPRAEDVQAERSVSAELVAAESDGAATPAADDDATRRRAAAASQDVAPIDEGAAAARTVRVRFALPPNQWLTKDATLFVTVRAADGGLSEHDLDPLPGPAHAWQLELPELPTGTESFGPMHAAGLVVRDEDVVVLDAALAQVRGADVEVALELVDGAELVWADHVPLDRRPPVELGLGGTFQPDSPRAANLGRRHGRPVRAEARELPIRLPRVVVPETLWCGAAGHVWRGFAVEPATTEVPIALAQAAALRVLHDVGVDEVARACVSAFDSGDSEEQTAVPGEPVLFTKRQAHWHKVWLEDGRGQRISRLAVVEALAGETVDVDLTRASLTDGRGALRLVLRGPAERLASPDLDVQLQRAAPPGRERAFEWYDTLTRLERDADQVVYEVAGLDPLPHRVIVHPLGATAVFEIEANTTTVVELSLLDVGNVVFELAEGTFEGTCYGHLRAADVPVEDAVAVPLDVVDAWPTPPREFVAGRYVARFDSIGFPGDTGADIAFESEPFVVAVGTTTTVVLTRVQQVELRVRVVDADTGQPIGFDVEFWVACAVRPLGQSASVQGSIAFEGGGGSYTATRWGVPLRPGLVEFTVPEHALYEFEAVAPFALAPSTTLELRARAK
jgi:hypothetical protein